MDKNISYWIYLKGGVNMCCYQLIMILEAIEKVRRNPDDP